MDERDEKNIFQRLIVRRIIRTKIRQPKSWVSYTLKKHKGSEDTATYKNTPIVTLTVTC